MNVFLKIYILYSYLYKRYTHKAFLGIMVIYLRKDAEIIINEKVKSRFYKQKTDFLPNKSMIATKGFVVLTVSSMASDISRKQ